eukprot:TRINITY_DN23510_c1_g1_i1.p1 TRINITY_DN23510_c1_g1~~TRINITY_DN23510_c1_g1_i1.p1  ORF type:complete len:305 (-),score=25.12 TRINITY_DN23510_c1_g1_i1:393-1307(-)
MLVCQVHLQSTNYHDNFQKDIRNEKYGRVLKHTLTIKQANNILRKLYKKDGELNKNIKTTVRHHKADVAFKMLENVLKKDQIHYTSIDLLQKLFKKIKGKNPFRKGQKEILLKLFNEKMELGHVLGDSELTDIQDQKYLINKHNAYLEYSLNLLEEMMDLTETYQYYACDQKLTKKARKIFDLINYVLAKEYKTNHQVELLSELFGKIENIVNENFFEKQYPDVIAINPFVQLAKSLQNQQWDDASCGPMSDYNRDFGQVISWNDNDEEVAALQIGPVWNEMERDKFVIKIKIGRKDVSDSDFD